MRWTSAKRACHSFTSVSSGLECTCVLATHTSCRRSPLTERPGASVASKTAISATLSCRTSSAIDDCVACKVEKLTSEQHAVPQRRASLNTSEAQLGYKLCVCHAEFVRGRVAAHRLGSTFMSRPCACFFCSGEKWLSDSDCAALLNSTCSCQYRDDLRLQTKG